ncbi:MAG: ethanolamine ammonia-lyase subunit EutB, partial [Bacteroidota bacterium]
MTRKEFIKQAGMAGAAVIVLNGCTLFSSEEERRIGKLEGVQLQTPKPGEDIFSYIQRTQGKYDLTSYQQILGAANAFKEGDQTLNIAALDETTRASARLLLSNTKLKAINEHIVFQDELLDLIQASIEPNSEVEHWTFQELKTFLLAKPEAEIKAIMPSLSSDVIACLVKLLSNEELIALSQKVFNPLPNSKIGSKGYLGARVQPNSPTDNIEDITWQVFNAWSYAVGDVVLGTNPVSSEPESVAKIEAALLDIIQTFELEDTIPNCVLSHVDVQAEVEATHPGTTGIWFRRCSGTK